MKVLTSKAPAAVVAERAHGSAIEVESVGGVDAERRVLDGENVDIVVLAEGAIARLADASRVLTTSQRLVLETEAVVAAAEGADLPDVSTPERLRTAVEASSAVAVSTGPSGDAVRRILTDWNLHDRVVTAPPGVPVGSLLLDGRADLAVQQRTEFDGMASVHVLGPLPGDLALTSRFVGAITTCCPQPTEAEDVLDRIAHTG